MPTEIPTKVNSTGIHSSSSCSRIGNHVPTPAESRYLSWLLLRKSVASLAHFQYAFTLFWVELIQCIGRVTLTSCIVENIVQLRNLAQREEWW